MSFTEEAVQANERYASSFTKSSLPMPPARHAAVVACMDARLVPSKFLGFEEGDVHVIRNAGGRAGEGGIRSLVISYKLLGTREFIVIHHTDCGMLTFTNDQLRSMLKNDLGADASNIDFLPFSDLEGSVVDDVQTLRSSPLIPKEIPITGFIYDV